MSRILLAFGPGDIAKAEQSGLALGNIWGAKILMNERYKSLHHDQKRSKGIEGSYNHIGACALVRVKGLETVVLDTKLSDDIPTEMQDSIKTILQEDAVQSPSVKKPKRPTFFTAQYLLPRAALESFVENVTANNIKPIINFPTSRFTDDDLKRITGDIDRSVAEAAVLCDELGAMLMIGAVDAPVAKEAAPEVKIIGFGGCLDDKELARTSHVRPALISETAPYVDVYGFGSSIFGSLDAVNAVEIREEAIAA